MCVSGDYGATAAGRGSLAACDDNETPYLNPYYLRTEGGLLLVGFCGGSPPASFTPCPSADAATADPPECACACELYPA